MISLRRNWKNKKQTDPAAERKQRQKEVEEK
jgi:hypothetical protein